MSYVQRGKASAAPTGAGVVVRKNSVTIGSPRGRLNFIEGPGIALSVSDTGSEITITIFAVTAGVDADWDLVTAGVTTSEDWGSIGTAADAAITYGGI